MNKEIAILYNELLFKKKALLNQINLENETLEKLRQINKSITERIQREKRYFEEQLRNKNFQKAKDELKKDLKDLIQRKEPITRIYYTKTAYINGKAVQVLSEVKEVPRSQSKQLKNSTLDHVKDYEEKGKNNSNIFDKLAALSNKKEASKERENIR